jgi:hypothetical protein
MDTGTLFRIKDIIPDKPHKRDARFQVREVWSYTEAEVGGFSRGGAHLLRAAHCSIIFCTAANPSVSAAGPGCKINDDLIS